MKGFYLDFDEARESKWVRNHSDLGRCLGNSVKVWGRWTRTSSAPRPPLFIVLGGSWHQSPMVRVVQFALIGYTSFGCQWPPTSKYDELATSRLLPAKSSCPLSPPSFLNAVALQVVQALFTIHWSRQAQLPSGLSLSKFFRSSNRLISYSACEKWTRIIQGIYIVINLYLLHTNMC